jgi:hypothetical protein
LEHFRTDALCSDTETAGSCCLKRYHDTIDDLNRSTVLSTASRSAVTEFVKMSEDYEDYATFLGKIGGMHGDIHSFFGAKAGTHFCGDSNGSPTYEPLFPVFHTFIDMALRLRTDCFDFDLLDADSIQDYEPYAFDSSYGGVDVSLDYVMDFSVICDEESHPGFGYMCAHQDITPRLMYNTGERLKPVLLREIVVR